MQWIEAKVSFDCEDESLAAELIADIFHDLKAGGVIVDDPRLEPDEGWGDDAVMRPETPAVTGYFQADSRLEAKRLTLERRVSKLAAVQPLEASVTYTPVDEEDWAESWKAFFWPEAITPAIVVKPSWREYTPSGDQMVIEIDPGMAFGTGTHPTTAMCIRLLEKHVFAGCSVLDVGTGSGILLVAASKLGARRLTGMDMDPMAVEVAGQNLKRNRIDPGAISLLCADRLDAVCRPHDLAVANILAEVILDLLDGITKVLKPGGTFICSGIITAYQSRVAEKLAARGFEILDIETDGDWAAFAGRLCKGCADQPD
jgi:ribosomal protein L11 methyltransferase